MINELEIKYCHLGNHDNNHQGVITLATYRDGSNIQYGVSYCSPNDNFNKKFGRTIALGRLKTVPCSIDVIGDITHRYIISNILEDILCTKDYPDWADDKIKDILDWYYSVKLPQKIVPYTLYVGDTSMSWEALEFHSDFDLAYVLEDMAKKLREEGLILE